MSPRGRPLDQALVAELAAGPGVAHRRRPLRGRRRAGHRRRAASRKSRSATMCFPAARSPRWRSSTRSSGCCPASWATPQSGGERELRRRAPRISALHPAAGLGGPRRSPRCSSPATTAGSPPGGGPRPSGSTAERRPDLKGRRGADALSQVQRWRRRRASGHLAELLQPEPGRLGHRGPRLGVGVVAVASDEGCARWCRTSRPSGRGPA